MQEYMAQQGDSSARLGDVFGDIGSKLSGQNEDGENIEAENIEGESAPASSDDAPAEEVQNDAE